MAVDINRFLEEIAEVVNGPGAWQTKREAILDKADPTDKTNLEEFASWFLSDEDDSDA